MTTEEGARIAALRALGMLDTPAEDRFDRITGMAKRLFGAHAAMITLVDADRQWYKSSTSDSVETRTEAWSFCANAVQSTGPLIVDDASKHPVYSQNPIVASAPHIRFYAGVPLAAPDGHQIGTLCIIDRRARQLSLAEIDDLIELARSAESELQVRALSAAQLQLVNELSATRELARVDPMLRTWTRDAIEKILDIELAQKRKDGGQLGIALVDVDRFKSINDTHGHHAGDATLKEIATRIRSSTRSTDALGRYGGDEFLLVFADVDRPTLEIICEKIRQRAAAEECQWGNARWRPSITAGAVHVDFALVQAPVDRMDLIAAADRALYEAKHAGRDCVRVAIHAGPNG
jgi:diguanylate cyclase (GGDEF)-like protein